MALQFRIRQSPRLPVDGRWCVPDRLLALQLAEIERLPVLCGNRSTLLAEIWDVKTLESDAFDVQLLGDHSSVEDLAQSMKTGRLNVQGEVGAGCGREISGGEIEINGDARQGLGQSLAGGRIVVRGDAADGVGGHATGARRGMTGGEIFITGNVGDFAGARMRRGLLWVGGSTGIGTGHAMIAGTIIVQGLLGPESGLGMKRGTIAQLTPQLSASQPAFSHACQMEARFLQLYARRLPSGWPISLPSFQQPFEHWRGDLLELGLGELLVATDFQLS